MIGGVSRFLICVMSNRVARELASFENAVLIYRCPNTARNVQGFVADDPSDDDTYEGIICTACGRLHLVNPKTAKVLGSDDDWGYLGSDQQSRLEVVSGAPLDISSSSTMCWIPARPILTLPCVSREDDVFGAG